MNKTLITASIVFLASSGFVWADGNASTTPSTSSNEEQPAAKIEVTDADVEAFYQTAYEACETTGRQDTKIKKSISKLPADYLESTCRCGLDRLKSQLSNDKIKAIIKHYLDEASETALEKAYAKSLINTYLQVASDSGVVCRNEYYVKHNLLD